MVDTLEEKAKNHAFTNGQSIGMFGTGFMSFRGRSDEIGLKKFIKLCIDILDIDEDEELFIVAKKTLAQPIKGVCFKLTLQNH